MAFVTNLKENIEFTFVSKVDSAASYKSYT